MNKELVISGFDNQYDTEPKLASITWLELVESFSVVNVYKKKSAAPAFSGAVYDEGSKRANENVRHLTLVVLDLDDGDLDSICSILEGKGWESIVYSTYSYTPEEPRSRVVILPDREIQVGEWNSLFIAMTEVFPDYIDKVCRDPARIYFLPSKPKEDAPEFYRHIQGSPMKVDDVIAAVKKLPVKTSKSKPSDAADVTSRQVADYAFNAIYDGKLWFHKGLFRVYDQGCWKAISVENEQLIVQRLLHEFSDESIRLINEAMQTLRGLAFHALPKNERPSLLVCLNNGVLDPTAGKLLPHSPAHRLTWALNATWSPDAEAPRFMRFLQEIWGHEADYEQRVEFLQQWFGYLLYPSCKFERFLWLVGNGANGKSVLLNIMSGLVGEENVSRAMLDRLGKAAVRAELEGKLLNISTEMNVNSTVADGYLKSIVSGEPIEADRKYRDSVSFVPFAKLVSSTNTLPRLLDRSGGFARRATILNFTREFGVHERELDLAEKILASEMDGLLAFAVKGLQGLLAQGAFSLPESSVQEVHRYREESNVVAMFTKECLDVGGGETELKELYEVFKVYCLKGGFKQCSRVEFGRRLTELDIDKRESNSKTYRKVTIRPGSPSNETVYKKASLESAFEV